MPVGIHQFRVLPQHVTFLERQRANPGAGAPAGPAATPRVDAQGTPAAPAVVSGAELASTAMLLVQCQTVQDIERDTHLLEPGLYSQSYDGPWVRVGE